MKKYNLIFIFYLITFLYLEIIFKVILNNNLFNLNIIITILFSIFFSSILTLLTTIFNEKINKTIFYITLSFNFFWFAASYVLKAFFGFYLTLSTFNLADQIANGFTGDAVNVVFAKIGFILLFSIPLILGILLNKKINFKYKSKKRLLLYLLIALFSGLLYFLSLNINKNKDYSAYELFYKRNDIEANVEKVGVVNSRLLDTYRKIFGFEDVIDINEENGEVIIDNPSEPIEPTEPIPEEKTYEQNVLNIDFDSMINNTKDTTLQKTSKYLKGLQPTYTNDYTGFFKDKNLVLFMAESFNSIAVSEELTPTLYKLSNNGFVFKNFYTPTIYSTIGGEFQELTGLYASSLDTLSAFRKNKNAFPFGIANMFKNAGYKTYAFHDSYSTFQDRDKYIPALGFTNFEGCESKKNKMDCKPWPGSDDSMVKLTIDKYSKELPVIDETNENEENIDDINIVEEIVDSTPIDEKFLVYYISVSGHGDYVSSSKYYKKYKDKIKVKYPNISVNSAAYIAGQMELDKALETLLKLLEERGLLEDTVIALVGDHAPYYLYEKSMDYINQISTYKRDNKIQLFRSNFILYNSAMENVDVTKVGSQIDVMPTLYNLFGLNYDSRMFMGNDILSDTPGLAIMADKSWVSDEGYYVYSKGKFTQTSENELSKDYTSNINKKVKNVTTMSKNIITKNYYKTITYKKDDTESQN